jgi:predicted alpha/beta superfamily hydrolase
MTTTIGRGLLASGLVAALITVLCPAAIGQAPSEAVDRTRVIQLPLASRVFGNTRTIRVYLPPGYSADSGTRYPVLYLNDGFAVFATHLWRAPLILDSLIDERAITPIILVGVDNAASIPGTANPGRARADEYLPYPDSMEPDLPQPRGRSYPRFLIDEVMPMIDGRFRTMEGPAGRVIGGASYGGIAALFTVLERPGTFGGLLLESTPLFISDGRLLTESGRFMRWPSTVYLGLGGQETGDSVLRARGEATLSALSDQIHRASPATRLHVNRVPDGRHNAASWRARFPAALTFLFGRTE